MIKLFRFGTDASPFVWRRTRPRNHNLHQNNPSAPRLTFKVMHSRAV